MNTGEHVVPCHPGQNAVWSVSGRSSCDHGVLSFQGCVTISTLLFSSNWNYKLICVVVPVSLSPPQPLKQRSKNKSEGSLRSQMFLFEIVTWLNGRELSLRPSIPWHWWCSGENIREIFRLSQSGSIWVWSWWVTFNYHPQINNLLPRTDH